MLVKSKTINWTEYLASVIIFLIALFRSDTRPGLVTWFFLIMPVIFYLIALTVKGRYTRFLGECVVTHLVFWTTFCMFGTGLYSTNTQYFFSSFFSNYGIQVVEFSVIVGVLGLISRNKRLNNSPVFQLVKYVITFAAFLWVFEGMFFTILLFATTLCLTKGICEQFYLKRSMAWGEYTQILYLALYNYMIGGQTVLYEMDPRFFILFFFALGALQFLQDKEIIVADKGNPNKKHKEVMLVYAHSNVTYEGIYGAALLEAGFLLTVISIWDKFWNAYTILWGIPVAMIVCFVLLSIDRWASLGTLIAYWVLSLFLLLAFSQTLSDNFLACRAFLLGALVGAIIVNFLIKRGHAKEDGFLMYGFWGICAIAMHFVMETTGVTLETLPSYQSRLLIYLFVVVLYILLLYRMAKFEGVKFQLKAFKETEDISPVDPMILAFYVFTIVTVIREIIR